MFKKYIIIGKIISAHGVTGNVKISSFTNPKSNIFKYTHVYIVQKNLQKIKLTQKGTSIHSFITSLSNINTRDAAKNLHSKFIYTKEFLLNNLQKDEYYWKDLLNLQVINSNNNNYYGKIINIFTNNEYNVLVIKTNENKLYYIPYIKHKYIKKVDLLNKQIFIDLI